MYNLTTDQVSEFDDFLSKVPISKVRSDIERIWDAAKAAKRFTSEQYEKINSFANALPLEFQTYPQSFLHYIKNSANAETVEAETKVSKKAQADLGADVADIHAKHKVKSKNTDDNTVVPTNDNGNKAAEKILPTRKDGNTVLETEQKKRDKQVDDNEHKKPVREGAKLNPDLKKSDKNESKKVVATPKKLAPVKSISKPALKKSAPKKGK